MDSELAGSENEEQLTEERIPEVAVDPIAGWTWQKKPDGVKRNYDEAVKYCRNLSIDDFSDWKLPSVQHLKQVFKQKYIFSSYKIDSSYWSTYIQYHKKTKDYKSYSVIVPTVLEFKNLIVHPKFFNDIEKGKVRDRRRYLSKIYDYGSDPFRSWTAKRRYLRDSLEEVKPDYTASDLDLVYNKFGLSDESNPRNKYYVRCMHD